MRYTLSAWLTVLAAFLAVPGPVGAGSTRHLPIEEVIPDIPIIVTGQVVAADRLDQDDVTWFIEVDGVLKGEPKFREFTLDGTPPRKRTVAVQLLRFHQPTPPTKAETKLTPPEVGDDRIWLLFPPDARGVHIVGCPKHLDKDLARGNEEAIKALIAKQRAATPNK